MRPNYSLGQVFLIDNNVIERILSILNLNPDDRVIELGAGPGFITKRMAELTAEVVAIEIDRKFQPLHEELFSTLRTKPLVLYEDALMVDYEVYTQDVKGRLVVFGNLPYYVTTDLILNSVQQLSSMACALFMIEKDVEERLVARPGSKKYGSLSIITGLFGQWRHERTVSRHAFSPKPHVTSSLVSLNPSCDEDCKKRAADPCFRRFLSDVFQYRRKTLVNALKTAYDSCIQIDDLVQLLTEQGFRPDVRAEQMNPFQFKVLFESLRLPICHLDENSVS